MICNSEQIKNPTWADEIKPSFCVAINNWPIFNNVCSWGHTLLGMASTQVSKEVEIGIAGSFLLYEINRTKPVSEMVVACMEYVLGMFVGYVVFGKGKV